MNRKTELSPEFLLYQTEDGQTRIEVRLTDETVWLNLSQMSELFGRDKSVISRHVRNVYEEGELPRAGTVANIATVQSEGERAVERQVDHYNLDVIISVGYRVKSHRGTQFRIWATQRLREYLIKGFALDDERFKAGGLGRYFDELLARIRDIRSSEKVFWRKVLDIYATSVDYDPHTDLSRQFFATLQNKMHWAAHGHTAAELIVLRADASQPHMGLTGWQGEKPRQSDAETAKSYLNEQEVEGLNRLVTIYLEFAENQARRRKPMTMQGWIGKLDEFLRISDYDILDHAGKVSNEAAMHKAHLEYEKYRQTILDLPSPVEKHFEEAVGKSEQLVQDLKKTFKRLFTINRMS